MKSIFSLLILATLVILPQVSQAQYYRPRKARPAVQPDRTPAHYARKLRAYESKIRDLREEVAYLRQQLKESDQYIYEMEHTLDTYEKALNRYDPDICRPRRKRHARRHKHSYPYSQYNH